MFKQQASKKLPTLIQWIKDNEITSGIVQEEIDTVFWTEEYRSITFFTEEFRHTIKFPTKSHWQDGINELLGSYSFKSPDVFYVEYEGETGEVEIILRKYTPGDKFSPKEITNTEKGMFTKPYRMGTKPALDKTGDIIPSKNDPLSPTTTEESGKRRQRRTQKAQEG